ncbi:hypothetical protein MRB53_028374 [Persea americana]|uniref:Uncharacterized protein n=1 Tax=Persea americana TaxID=3435 RepID=A0ACC2KFC1_PERAE|nr:hypothetical protein MRB53_028374 [Persea americana]
MASLIMEPLDPLKTPVTLNPFPPIALPETQANPRSNVSFPRSRAPLPFPKSKPHLKPIAINNLSLSVLLGNQAPLLIPTLVVLSPSDRGFSAPSGNRAHLLIPTSAALSTSDIGLQPSPLQVPDGHPQT